MTTASETTTSTVIDSPVGPLTLVATETSLRAVLWADDRPDRVPAAIGAEPLDPSGSHEVLAAATRQLGEYFDGTRTAFDLPLDAVGTEFQHEAWAALCEIPFAETVTYGEQATTMGDPKRARAVGAANGRNPISIIVPCPRVVGADGSLTGFAGGVDAKRWLLDHERRVAGHTLL